MEITDQNLVTLSEFLAKTLSPDVAIRKPAEQFLQSLDRNQNYPILLLKVIQKDSFNMTIRISASVVFKNYIKRNWKIEDGEDYICQQDRDAIKTYIVDLMLSSPEAIQKQLSDAVSIIGKYDFPDKWPGLLDEMIRKFSTGDFNVINGVLRTGHSLFKKYRYEFKSQQLWTEIKFVLDSFSKPLTDLFVATMQLTETQTSPEVLSIVFNSLLMISKIFYSLNYQDLPEFFEDNMAVWMNNFHVLLTGNYAALVTANDDEEAGIIEQLRSQICENLVMYAQKYDEEFAPHLPRFVDDIWNLLMALGAQTKYDILVSNAMTFLSTVADRKQYQHLFADAKVLGSICEKVIFPNIQFRTSDEELFEDNPDEYIRRDIEGSDVDTRRRAACDLVKVLTRYFEQEIKQIFVTYVKEMLQTYMTTPARWQCKNAAIFLVTSLESRGQTQKFGVTQISNLVNLNEFAVQHILPELQKANVNELPVIKADCIRYLMTFRNILPKEVIISSLPLLTQHLVADSKVVHTYAASCIEKILLIRDPTTGKSIVDADILMTLAEKQLEGLFIALTKQGSGENEYVMKAILRTLFVLNDKVMPFLEKVLTQLIIKLQAVAKNPSNPQFNHALFETIALCIKIVCSARPAEVGAFEIALFPVFQIILQNDVLEFLPYVFQLLSMLLEYRVKGEPIPLPYFELYQFLFMPVLWERSGNVHPLVRLLAAYITRMNPTEMQSNLQLNSVLGVFEKLVSSKAHDHEGLFLLRTLTENCPNELLEPTRKSVFIILLKRLSSNKTIKFIKGLSVYLSFFMITHGVTNLITLLDSIQKDLFLQTLEKVLLHEEATGTALVEKKIIVAGLTRLLCEADDLIVGPNARFWPFILKQILKTVSKTDESAKVEEEVILALPGDGGYEVVYSKLIYASKPEYDPLQGVGDISHYFANNLATLSNKHPGRLLPLISNKLNEEEAQLLKNILSAANIQLT
ncbi:hypothetical protein V9T40_004933 [Parthenolecanium corni]|uniref:Exportin-2 n=1 Tax=Parthenolecanium corni TaxID=536013 RepID=A0AAN9TD84_9HEMI